MMAHFKLQPVGARHEFLKRHENFGIIFVGPGIRRDDLAPWTEKMLDNGGKTVDAHGFCTSEARDYFYGYRAPSL